MCPAKEPETASDQTIVEHTEISTSPCRAPSSCKSGEFYCGFGAAFINICVTFPMNKAIFRQQLHNISSLTAFQQLSKDGFRHLYRGLLPPLMQKTSSVAIMFGGYNNCQDWLKTMFPSLNVQVNHTLAALIAGTLEATLAPFERVQTLMQTAAFHDKFSNTVSAFRGLHSYGLKEYYRGFTIIVLRNGPSNVIFFLGREHLQAIGPQDLVGGQEVTLIISVIDNLSRVK